MRPHKNSFAAIVGAFADEHREGVHHLLDALGELLEPVRGESAPRQILLAELITTAAKRAALDDPHRPLDQGYARKVSLAFFRRLEAARHGKLIVGRRGRATRFRFAKTADADNGPEALRNAVRKTPSWIADDWGIPVRAMRAADAPASSQSTDSDRLRRDDVVARLTAKRDEIHAFGLSSLALFGSVARDEARPDSDVDLLATFESGVTSDRFFGAKFFLEDLLGKRIDLVTQDALRERVRQNIEPELIRVA